MAWKNNIENKEFRAKDNYTEVIFGDDGDFSLGQMGFVEEKDTFIVEVEEEITENTRLDELVVRYRNDDIYIFPQEIINDFKNDSSIVAFYIPNDDLTLTLIWTREKGLVE